MIKSTGSHTHWNYFYALDNDLEKVSRFIEFADANLETYSIELTHLLLSAASEVDVVLKQACVLLCQLDGKKVKVENIEDYRNIIMESDIFKLICSEPVFIPRYGIHTHPFENWLSGRRMDWWKSYNNVKHERNVYYKEANLKNTINAIGALLLSLSYYDQIFWLVNNRTFKWIYQITGEVQEGRTTFVRMHDKHYKKEEISIDEIATKLRILDKQKKR